MRDHMRTELTLTAPMMAARIHLAIGYLTPEQAERKASQPQCPPRRGKIRMLEIACRSSMPRVLVRDNIIIRANCASFDQNSPMLPLSQFGSVSTILARRDLPYGLRA